MFSRTSTSSCTSSFLCEINRLKYELESCDAVVIGAGAGLSTAAGFTYTGERFTKYFSDFIAKYGFSDMYSGGFYPFKTAEEHWAYWSRYIYINRYCDIDNGVYKRLFELVKSKNYFVLTTNVDHQFRKAGFDKKRLFYTQGDYGLFQCSVPCCNKTFDNELIIKQMVNEQKNMRIPTELVPKCPECGKCLTMNLRSDELFVEDEGWCAANERYSAFLRSNIDRHILFLELGVGLNTPAIIKIPFIKITEQNPKAIYACINKDGIYYSDKIAARSIFIEDSIENVI